MHKAAYKIMILTSRFGEGHWMVTQALKGHMERLGMQVIVVDLMAEAHPMMDAMFRFIFMQSQTMSQYGIHYYGWSYYSTRRIERTHPLVRTGFTLGKRKLKQLLLEHRPDGIISTFPYFDVSSVVRQMNKAIPTFTVITDYDLHHRWILSTTDHYYVATVELAEQMMRAGIAPDLVHVSGIPIRDQFDLYSQQYTMQSSMQNEEQVEALFHKYGLHSGLRTTLVMSGGLGAQAISNRFLRLLERIPNHQVVIVCGRNERWETELTEKFRSLSNVHVFGYVSSIHELMLCANAMVTKAGGVTLTEALAMQVPLFIARPQPGQERENARYFARHGAAVVVRQDVELAMRLCEAYNQPALLESMKRSMVSLARPYAAKRIAIDILDAMTSETYSAQSSLRVSQCLAAMVNNATHTSSEDTANAAEN
ncbi:glycosyltransferase [Paenibacillus sp. chi10]|uniref:Glycosyltransferase n=1 Tax=Paenibacillus suaedae TaxID=3077233 RepID=A0AAJ2JT95_9BACL|nr:MULTISPECIES: glycosyltransferase [unclassified Paenibacillus]MDT8975396.1 glycosyltransferase [Paenibacillus sp. chi10]GAV15369.1 processive diacylglycerol glucosyltransferase UgtP [Paenibacillus sp. NAIST15-1]